MDAGRRGGGEDPPPHPKICFDHFLFHITFLFDIIFFILFVFIQFPIAHYFFCWYQIWLGLTRWPDYLGGSISVFTRRGNEPPQHNELKGCVFLYCNNIFLQNQWTTLEHKSNAPNTIDKIWNKLSSPPKHNQKTIRSKVHGSGLELQNLIKPMQNTENHAPKQNRISRKFKTGTPGHAIWGGRSWAQGVANQPKNTRQRRGAGGAGARAPRTTTAYGVALIARTLHINVQHPGGRGVPTPCMVSS